MKVSQLINEVCDLVEQGANSAIARKKFIEYFNAENLRVMDAEDRNRLIVNIKSGIKANAARRWRESSSKLSEKEFSKIINEALSMIVNDLDYSVPRPRGRQPGVTPSGNPPMVKKTKSWSLPAESWEWLESQPNQSEAIRQAIALYREQKQ